MGEQINLGCSCPGGTGGAWIGGDGRVRIINGHPDDHFAVVESVEQADRLIELLIESKKAMS